MSLFLGIVIIGIYLIELVKMVKKVKSFLSGYLELKNVRELASVKIKLENVQSYTNSRVKPIIWCGLAIFASGYASSLVFTSFHKILLKSSFLLLFLMSCVDLLIVLAVYCYEQECYLTRQGIAAIEGVYKKPECRFVMEQEDSGSEGWHLNVYKGKMDYPYRFKVIERELEIEEIIRQLQGNGM